MEAGKDCTTWRLGCQTTPPDLARHLGLLDNLPRIPACFYALSLALHCPLPVAPREVLQVFWIWLVNWVAQALQNCLRVEDVSM